MRPRWKKVLHDLFDNITRTLLVVISIAIGVFSIGVITGTYQIISSDMSASYARTNPMNIDMRTDPFDDDLLDMVENVHTVKQAEGRRIIPLRVRTPGSTSWTTVTLVAVDDFKKLEINQLTSLEGKPYPDKKEIVLDQRALEDLAVKVGGSLEIQLSDGTIKSMPMVGIVQDQATGAGDFLSPPLAFIKMETLTSLKQPRLYNRMFIVLAEDGNNETYIRNQAADIKDKIEKNDIAVLRMNITKTDEHPMANLVKAILGILLALGVLILFLSSSLIANTLNALLTQHLRHIGVMKLIGARRKQIIALYVLLIVGFSLLALALAVPLGGQGAYALSQYIADKLNFQISDYRIVPIALIVQLIVGLAVPILVGLIPVINGSGISVHSALSNIGTESEKKKEHPQYSVYDQLDHKFRKSTAKRGIHFPRPLLISLRNTFRNKGRLALTLFTLTMGGAIFIAVFNSRVTLHDYINQMSNYFIADITLDFDQSYRINNIKNLAMRVPGVTHVEGWTYADAECISTSGTTLDNITVLAPPEHSTLVEPNLLMGRWLQPGDRQVMTVSESIWEKFPGLKPGDILRLKIFGKEDDWTVAGIFQFPNQEGTIGYANYEYLSQLNNQANQSYSYRVVLDNHDPANQKLMSEKLDQYFRDLGYQLREAKTGKSTMQRASEYLDILIAFLLIMAILTASVGSIGLAGSMSMNVLERTREIGIMRSIGAVDKKIMEMVIIEGTVVGVISWFLGCIVSITITFLLNNIISVTIFNSPIQVIFTWTGYTLWLMLVLALSAVASILPARNAARLTIREVLAYE